MTVEVNEHHSWTSNYLVDRLKEHLATFEVPVALGNNEKMYDRRKYYQLAHKSLLFGALRPVPPFICQLYLQDDA